MKNIPCTSCRPASAFEFCTRCSAPLCMEHACIGDTRCVHCEVDYAGRLDGVRFWRWFVVAFAAPWPGAWMLVNPIATTYPGSSGGYRAMTTGSPIVDMLVITLFASVALGSASVKLRRRVLRRSFLRQVGATPKRVKRPSTEI